MLSNLFAVCKAQKSDQWELYYLSMLMNLPNDSFGVENIDEEPFIAARS